MIRPSRFFWRIFLAQVSVLALVLLVCLGLVVSDRERAALSALDAWLDAQARTAGEFWPTIASLAGNRAEADRAARRLALAGGGRLRVTFIAADGTVLADSAAQPATDNHADRPEVRGALERGSARSRRWSHTMSEHWRYSAFRIGIAPEASGVARASLPQEEYDAAAAAALRSTGLIFALAWVVGALIALGLSRLLSVPLRRLVRLARRQEAPSARSPAYADEVDALAESLTRMREELTVTEALLEHHRGTFELLMAQLRDGVVVADARGRIVLINPAAMQLLDLTTTAGGGAGVFQGKPIEACIPLLELQGMLRTNESGGEGDGVEGASGGDRRVELRRRGGSVVLLARSSPIRLLGAAAEGGEDQVGRLLILTDVTELARTVQVRSDFVANASHELRTPLAAIRMASEMLRSVDAASEPEELRRCLEVIDRHTAWLEELVRDLLDLSKLESPMARFQPRIIEVERFVSELAERFAATIERKGLTFRVDGSGGPRRITVNPSLLRMVLDNLVDNALKFTPPGGRVTVLWRTAERQVIFEVVDTGCGVPIEDQARVFERFYQVERARSGAGEDMPRGTGLGLSIVRHAVAAMRGQIELHSVLGRGTRMQVSLPQGLRPLEEAEDIQDSFDAAGAAGSQ
ncbi:MAG: Adaptive-response sensory-kinase SasA [Phycisphaerae bacterium]|nr:Adaptive-response sensory-kinase SasA [Phycisphaerae bacterium]